MKISSNVVNAAREAKEELAPLLDKLDFKVISRYNVGYLKYQKDPVRYFIDMEIKRFLYTSDYIYKNFHRCSKILDIGLFIPVLPIMLSKLGYQVEAIEKLSLYENTLDPIIEFIEEKYSIKVHNVDIIHGNLAALTNQFEIVLLMAILEHLNGSPKKLLEKCKSILKEGGALFVDGPNIASLPKRLSFFIKGRSPLPEYSDYFLSDYPFEGHNREYTYKELQYALTSAGFKLYKYEFLSTTLPPEAKFLSRISKIISNFGPKNWQDVIWTVSKTVEKTINEK